MDLEKIKHIDIDKDYNYSPVATKYLDGKIAGFSAGNFTLQDLYEIMLWKLNRFPSLCQKKLGDETIACIKEAAAIESLDTEREKALSIIKALLNVNGFEIPMISTILSFVNPSVFQIIDGRTNRIILGLDPIYDKNYKSANKNNGAAEYYLTYLAELRKYDHPFKTAGRFFYLVDIDCGNKVDDEVETKKKEIQQIQNLFRKSN